MPSQGCDLSFLSAVSASQTAAVGMRTYAEGRPVSLAPVNRPRALSPFVLKQGWVPVPRANRLPHAGAQSSVLGLAPFHFVTCVHHRFFCENLLFLGLRRCPARTRSGKAVRTMEKTMRNKSLMIAAAVVSESLNGSPSAATSSWQQPLPLYSNSPTHGMNRGKSVDFAQGWRESTPPCFGSTALR
jgi:hypothetical protein